MRKEPINRSIVSSICDIGHATGKVIIAECVEDVHMISDLQKLGVDHAQGFGISRPTAIGTNGRYKKAE